MKWRSGRQNFGTNSTLRLIERFIHYTPESYVKEFILVRSYSIGAHTLNIKRKECTYNLTIQQKLSTVSQLRAR